MMSVFAHAFDSVPRYTIDAFYLFKYVFLKVRIYQYFFPSSTMMSLASKPYRVLDHLTWIHVAVISKTAFASFSERIIIAKGFHRVV